MRSHERRANSRKTNAVCACTIVSNSYLALARVFAESYIHRFAGLPRPEPFSWDRIPAMPGMYHPMVEGSVPVGLINIKHAASETYVAGFFNLQRWPFGSVLQTSLENRDSRHSIVVHEFAGAVE